METEVKIAKLKIKLSESTLDSLIEYKSYRSAGGAWLARHDPMCKYEKLIIDDVCRYFRKDVEMATENLSLEEYDKFYEAFEDKDFDEYIPKLLKVLKKLKANT